MEITTEINNLIPIYIEAINVENKKIKKENKQAKNPIPYKKDFRDKVMKRFIWFYGNMCSKLSNVKFFFNKETKRLETTLTCAAGEIVVPHDQVFEDFVLSAYHSVFAKTTGFSLKIGGK